MLVDADKHRSRKRALALILKGDVRRKRDAGRFAINKTRLILLKPVDTTTNIKQTKKLELQPFGWFFSERKFPYATWWPE